MTGFWRRLAWATGATVALLSAPARGDEAEARQVLQMWMRLTLELVRHTPTYTPPVASRSFAYVGVTAFEVARLDDPGLTSLAGQLNGLTPLPQPPAGAALDEALVLHAALSIVVADLFSNTGPTGQRALTAVTADLRANLLEGLSSAQVADSDAIGMALAGHILDWSHADGGSVIDNMGFAVAYAAARPGDWVPTGLVRLQQAPLLPGWGLNRPFAMPAGSTCALPPPVSYSEDPGSEYYAQALEVVDIKTTLTPDQIAVARYWADDAMLSMTPPGHWVAIAMQIFARDDMPLDSQAEVLARLGVALADSFIGCWDAKFTYNTLRPVTYIRGVMGDATWEPLLLTPPFPEYPSGHSVQSAAAAVVLSAYFGDDFGFEDASLSDDGLPPRAFASFWAAAEEAGISRLYGGIHYREAIEQGLEQGRCIGAFAAALVTRS